VSSPTAEVAAPEHRSCRPLALILDRRTRLAALAVLLAGAALAVSSLGVPDPAQLRAAVAPDAVWTPLAAVLVAAALAVVLFPRAGIALLAGLLFGPLPATVYTVVGTVLGASIAFGIGRTLGRPYLAAYTGRRPDHHRLVRLQGWLERRGVLAVVYVRLVPLLPFGLLNYCFGATRVSLRAFAFGTGAAILPSTVVYATLGASVTRPGSPAFLVSTALVALLALASALHLRTSRRRTTVA